MTGTGAEPAQTGGQSVARIVILLRTLPAGIGEVLAPVAPTVAQSLHGAPVSRIEVTVNGVPVTFHLRSEPLRARELDYAVAQSPLSALVSEAVARHVAHLVVSVEAPTDVFDAHHVVSQLGAAFAQENGLAVWLPDADLATTDVMYVGEVSERPALNWFHTMAARLDETASIAHTIGLGRFGAPDVQLVSSVLAPAEAHAALRDAVAGILEARRVPEAGDYVHVAGVASVLTPGQSRLGMPVVLDVVTAPPPDGEAPSAGRGPRRRWFGGR
ncbi:hypothetical protein [Microbacterium sp. CIAB417]|uniref:hypothetical protein n=1 Tax=Microbacterium sp. CIAB417 TaxID=2860287 RepID=UPI001FAE543C|nr:hypothetical protein [Microbacterium sp. CIAB417]